VTMKLVKEADKRVISNKNIPIKGMLPFQITETLGLYTRNWYTI